MKIPSFGPLIDTVCPVCAGRQADPVTTEAVFGEVFKVVCCVRCGLIRTNPAPSPEWKKNFYDPACNGFMESNDRDFVYLPSSSRMPAYHSILSLLRQQFPERTRLLDVGCAAGLFVETAKTYGFDAFGGDFSAAAVQYGKRTMGLNLFQSHAETLPFKDNSFDVITMLELIEHFIDPLQAIKEVRRVLRPSGIFLIETPNYLPYYYFEKYLHFLKPMYTRVTGRKHMPWFPFDHLVHWTSETLLAALDQAGFEDGKTHYVKNFRIEAAIDRSPSAFYRLYSALGNAIYCLFHHENLNFRTALITTAVKKEK